MRDYSEDKLVEQPAIELLQSLGWDFKNCYHEKMGASGTLGRGSRQEVVLERSLKSALRRINFSEASLGVFSPSPHI